MRKFPVQLLCRSIVGASGIFGRIKKAKILLVPFGLNHCAPSTALLVEVNSLKSRFILALKATIQIVLAMRDLAKIAAAIIERVSVDVIALLCADAPKYFSVHTNLCRLVLKSAGVETLIPFLVSPRIPMKFRKPLVVGGIDDGYLALRQGNVTDRFVFWLRNGLPLDTALRHESSLKGLVYAAIFS